MIVFFALLGISCKRKIFPKLIRYWKSSGFVMVIAIRVCNHCNLAYQLKGQTAHWVYMFLCLVNNLIACANMLLGASAVITAMWACLSSVSGCPG